jgi:hypothetical protein
MQWIHATRTALAAAAIASAALAAGTAHAGAITIDVSGAMSVGELGDSGNEIRFVSLATGARVTGISWDVTLIADAPSWLSEMGIDISDNGGAGFQLFPGFGDDSSGSASYSGTFDLVAAGLDFTVGASAQLMLEFFEFLDDDTVSPDGMWARGSTITVSYVPEPASFGLAGLALLGAGLATRRRRPVEAVPVAA